METRIIERSKELIKDNFTQISKDAIQNPNLSWKARGLLAYLISLPSDFEIRKTEVASHSRDGLTATLAAFKELEKFGYLVSLNIFNERHQFGGIRYIVNGISIFDRNSEIWNVKNWPVNN